MTTLAFDYSGPRVSSPTGSVSALWTDETVRPSRVEQCLDAFSVSTKLAFELNIIGCDRQFVGHGFLHK